MTQPLTPRVRAAKMRAMTDLSPTPPDIATLSFEDALSELESIVRQLEAGDVPLDQSVDLYARGDALRAHCEARLKSAEARIEQITLSGDQATGTRPFAAD